MELDELLDQLVSNIPSIKINRNYWLIRTQGGAFYSDFVENNYVAIEPANVTRTAFDIIQKKAAGNPTQLSRLLKDHIRAAALASNDKELSNRTVGLSANQILRFVNEVKEGDIVIIPSEHSNLVSIGEVESSALTNLSDGESEKISCPYDLRKKIKWLKELRRTKLDVNLYMVFTTHQMISQINKFANEIERSVNDFYILFENAHLILNVEKNGDIPAKDLFGFGHLLLTLLDEYADYNNLSISSNDIELEININSPGKLDLKSQIKKTTLVLSVIVGVFGGGFDIKILGQTVSLHTEGLPGLIKSVEQFMKDGKDTETQKKALVKYQNSLQIKPTKEINNLLKAAQNGKTSKNK